jgi:type III pantothenate kinase
MILAIDISNSVITIGCVDDSHIYFVEQLSSNLRATPLEYCVSFHMMFQLHHIDKSQIEGCMISSVVAPITSVIRLALEKLRLHPIKVVGPGIKTGLNIKIDNPTQLGSDLAVNAVAAIHEYPKPIIIIHLGTATSFSVIDQNNYYLGGCLMPGISASLDAMSKVTSQLPLITLEKPKKLIGRNTTECMKSGTFYGNAAMIDGMIDRFEAELGQPAATLVASGRFAHDLIPCCMHDIIIDQELLLKGLWILYQKNR